MEAWHTVDAKRRELVARGRSASSDLARAWKKDLRESKASLAAARRELHIAAQRQHAGLRHDVLVLLILLNRIGMRATGLEQHM